MLYIVHANNDYHCVQSEATLRGCLLDAAHALSSLYARKAVAALLAAMPAVVGLPVLGTANATSASDAPASGGVIPPFGLDMLGCAPMPAPAPTAPAAADTHEGLAKLAAAVAASQDDLNDNDVVLIDFPRTPPAAISDTYATTHPSAAASSLIRTVLLLSLRGVGMAAGDVALLAARPTLYAAAAFAQSAHAAKLRLALEAAGTGSAPERVAVVSKLRRPHPAYPNAAGAWRIDPSDASLPSHGLALVDRALAAALVREVTDGFVSGAATLQSA
jgi:hypothetical protein